MRPTLLVLALALTLFAADPPEVTRAREAHTAELDRLRQKLLDDIDAVIRTEQGRGAGTDYLQKERKGFEENGVTPILPKLLPASNAYLYGKERANEVLAKALDRAGLRQEARDLRHPPERARPETDPPDRPAGKDEFRAGTVWVGTTTNAAEKWAAQPITLVVVSRDGRRFKGIERYETRDGKGGYSDIDGTVDGSKVEWGITTEPGRHRHAGRTADGTLTFRWASPGPNSGEGSLRLVRP